VVLEGAALLDYPDQVLNGHTAEVTSIAFSPDGRQVLTGSTDNTARLWDSETGREVQRFSGHGGPVRSVAFAPGGKQILTGSLDGSIQLWRIEGGKPLWIFYNTISSTSGKTPVYSVAFSPDSKYIVAGGGGLGRPIMGCADSP
jgi:WD40 repeat protein